MGSRTLVEELLEALKDLNLRHDTTLESPVNIADAYVLRQIIELRLRAYLTWTKQHGHRVQADYFCREDLR